MLEVAYAKKIAPKGCVDIMEHAGFKTRLMRAERLIGDGTHGLPPGEPVPVYPIAALPSAPESWIREAGTYVCPVAPDWGLWFDWTMNDPGNTAIVPSVKGMNPITGQRITMIGMEQYKDKCPIHGDNLSHERFCEKCGYKWPPQNYVCYPNTLWWDGFRQPDGTVAQFFFTEDQQKDIASLVIGEKNTVPAFGFAFFRTKTHREIPGASYRGLPSESYTNPDMAWFGSPGKEMLFNCDQTDQIDQIDNLSDGEIKTSGDFVIGSSTVSQNASKQELDSVNKQLASIANDDSLQITTHHTVLRGSDSTVKMASKSASVPNTKPVFFSPMHTPQNWKIADERIRAQKRKEEKTVSVGGGAKIRQELTADAFEVSDWHEKESAVIRLYFVFEQQFRDMIERGGIKDIDGSSDGYLEGLPTG